MTAKRDWINKKKKKLAFHEMSIVASELNSLNNLSAQSSNSISLANAEWYVLFTFILFPYIFSYLFLFLSKCVFMIYFFRHFECVQNIWRSNFSIFHILINVSEFIRATAYEKKNQ